jgi:hypothetical protein
MPVTDSSSSAVPWHTAYPAPDCEPTAISREDVLEMLKANDDEAGSGKDFVLVDLRRTDHEVHSLGLLHTSFAWVLMHAGRNYTWVHKSACADFIPYHSYFVRIVQDRRLAQHYMVLW